MDRETERSERALVGIKGVRKILREAEAAEKDEEEQEEVRRVLEPPFKEAEFWEKTIKRWEEARNTVEHARTLGGDREADLVEAMIHDALYRGGDDTVRRQEGEDDDVDPEMPALAHTDGTVGGARDTDQKWRCLKCGETIDALEDQGC